MASQPHEISIDHGRKSAFAVWWSRVTPFAFTTLDEIPWPTWALPTMILAFAFLWHEYEKHVDLSPVLRGSLSHCIYRIRHQGAPLPEVLICGSSANGFGVGREFLENRIGVPVGKVTLGGTWCWEAEHILKKYPRETENVKLVVMDLYSWVLSLPPEGFRYQNGNSFHILKDPLDFSKKNRDFIRSQKHNKLLKTKDSKYLPMRMTLKYFDIFWREPPFVDGHEIHWTREDFFEKRKPVVADMKRVSESRLTPPERHLTEYHERTEAIIWDFVRYCESRNIFVIFNFTPGWRMFPSIYPEGENLTDADLRFIALCRTLDAHPNCRVFYLRDFHEIAPERDEQELFFDGTHMTRDGAWIYTNWLADRMLEQDKIRIALTNPRPKTESFVGKRIREIREGFAEMTREKIVPLDMPQVTAETAPDGVVLSWEPVPEARWYSVWRYNADATWFCIKTDLSGFRYIDTAAPPGKKTFYTVRAHRGESESEPSNAVYATVSNRKNRDEINPPLVTAANASDGIELSWEPVPEAERYSVWRYNADATWFCIKTDFSGSRYIDTAAPPGKKTFYTVRAHRGESESEPSNAVYAVVPASTIAAPIPKEPVR